MNQAKNNLKSLFKDASFKDYAPSRFSTIVKRESARRAENASSFSLAKKHSRLNRYIDILPFDNNIVKLNDKRLGSNEYINASWIVSGKNTYIATQGPLPSTVIDFWRMVIEHDVPVIVCLTPQYEKNTEKCAKYWPDESNNNNNELVFPTTEKGKFIVKTVSKKEDTASASDIREISIDIYDNNDSLISSKQVHQLQFLGWPDHGVPEDTTNVIELIKRTREYKVDGKPVVVHCSAGCGRTGTFCVIDSADCLLKENPNFEFDPVWILTDEFRKQRVTMVQTLAQYIFCYRALLDMPEK